MICDEKLGATMIYWARLIHSFFFSAINEVTLLWAMIIASKGRVLPRGEALPKFLGKARFGPPLSYPVVPVPWRGIVCPKIAVKVWEMPRHYVTSFVIMYCQL